MLGNESVDEVTTTEWSSTFCREEVGGPEGDGTNESIPLCWMNVTTTIMSGAGMNNSFIPSPLFQAVIYSMYSLVFVLALVGNMIVCAVVFTSIRKWTVTNFFIVNMAAGDILMAFFCIPFTFVPTFVLLYWPFGAVMCRIVSFSQAVSVFVTAYTMVAISSDRYLAIVYPLRPRMTRNQAKWIITFVWIVATLTALPTLLVSELILPDNSWHQEGERYICQEMWEDRIQQTQYTYVLLVLQYCFPLAVLLFTYGRIGLEIWGKKTPGEAHQNRDLRMARSKRKMIKMMIIVVVVFAVSWLPFNAIQIIGDRYPEIWSWRKINYVFFACHWLAMSHSAYNPIIYCCFNSKFRQGFHSLAILCGCRRCYGEGNNEASEHWVAAAECGGYAGGRDQSTLQRGNTFSTFTCNGVARRSSMNKNSSCRIVLPNHVQYHPSQHRLVNQQHPEIIGFHRRSNGGPHPPGRSMELHPMLHLSPPFCAVAVKPARGVTHRNRPPKLVFRASNFSTSSQSGGGSYGGSVILPSPTAPSPGGQSSATTAESHM